MRVCIERKRINEGIILQSPFCDIPIPIFKLFLFYLNGKILHLLTLGRGDPDSGEIQNNFEFSRSGFPCVCKIDCMNSTNSTFFPNFPPLYAYSR